jgi:hypothetical protein
MSRKLIYLSGITSFFLTTSAFKMQTPVWNGPENWAALFVVFVIIFFLAILLIYQRSLTPSNLTHYHLDHAEHGQEVVHGKDEYAGAKSEEHPSSTDGETPEEGEIPSSIVDADEPQEE